MPEEPEQKGTAMNEVTPGHVYGLSYQSSQWKGKGKKPPELLFHLSAANWQRVKDFFETKLTLERIGAKEYLQGEFSTSWEEPSLNLDMEERFGFAACGYVTLIDEEVSIHFSLVASSIKETALSLHTLLLVMDIVLLAEEQKRSCPSSNRSQLVSISTRCSREFSYGHGTYGYVFPAFRKWLHKKGSEPDCDLTPVVEAMKEAHYALHFFESKSEERDNRELMDACFRARISTDGRFILECPGNACDLAIYPDGIDRDLDFWCTFSCHNLDAATQQLTLLSGLAVLSDLALKEMEII